MNAKIIASDSTVILDKLTEIKNAQIQRNREIIEQSQNKLSNLKIARMEIKYFVACSFDCLSRTMPQLSSQQTSSPTIIDFNDARVRRLNNQHPQKEQPGSQDYQLPYSLGSSLQSL